MLEIVVAVILGAALLLVVFFVARNGSGRSAAAKPHCHEEKLGGEVPGWNQSPADPIMGDLKEALSGGSLHHYLAQKHQDGRCPVAAFWWKDQRVVTVCSPAAFKATQTLYNRPKLIFAPCFEPLHGSQSIQSVNYGEWEDRKKLLHGTVRGERLESFFEDFVQIARETVSLWSGRQPNNVINLKKEMFRMTCKAILCTSLGNIFEDDSGIEELANMYDLCKCEMDKRILDVPAPDSQRELEFQSNLKHLMGQLKKMMHCRKEEKNGCRKLPLLDALLQSGACEEVILSDMVSFLGGFHTAAYFATWTFCYLAQHPSVQKKLLAEVRERVGAPGESDEQLRAYTLTSNSYLRQFLDESLRVSTTVSFSSHYSDEDCVVDGYHVPAKTPIIHAIGVAMKNGTAWEDPNTFNPDRFDPGTDHAKRGPEFRPFGVPYIRRCPANHFVYFMMSVYVTVLLQRFVFLSVDEEEPQKKHGIATAPKDDIFIRVQLRD